jgi:hypothetical protein
VEATGSLLLDSWNIKVEMLVNFLMEVLDAYYNAGSEVVATLCDMGANIKALKE